jgi:hypothetical protein
MSSTVWSKSLIAGCGLAVAISGTACNRDDAAAVDRDTDRIAADTSRQAGHQGAPITLTGCLQRGSGLNNYILTQVNEPSDTPVATAGKESSGTAVQREQMREAKHSYELDGDNKDAMRNLVGKQVRVTGTIAETSELHREAAEKRDSSDRREGLDIDRGDLAKVDVQGIVQVAEVCGGSR